MNPDIIALRINEAFEELFVKNTLGERKPVVCAVCDEIVPPKEKTILPVDWLTGEKQLDLLRPSWQNLSEELRSCYKICSSNVMESDDPHNCPEVINKLESLLLSPRSTYVRFPKNKSRSGFTCCRTCKQTLGRHCLPMMAIKNNNCVGMPPQCLLELTETELAYLTPVKNYGYCFSYTGGKILQGSLSFFKVKVRSIVRGITQLDVLGLRKDMVHIYYGSMTRNQKKRAEELANLRVHKVMTAIEWLLCWNCEWMKHSVNLDELRQEISDTKPVIIDDSAVMEGDQSQNMSDDVEATETFRVFFPDGTMTPDSAGQGTTQRLTELLRTMKDHGYDVDYQCNFAKECVSDMKNGNFVNACLLQFPYGRGGMEEPRLEPDGSMSNAIDLDAYLKHLSRLSMPHFHHDRFALILYNMSMRRTMVKNAGWRVRRKLTSSQIATDLRKEDLDRALDQRLRRQNTTGSGGHFLNAVDAVTKSVPHSDGATKRARLEAESFCHKFGSPHVFLTVAPDDESSYFILVHTLETELLPSDFDPDRLTDEQLNEFYKVRHKTRIKYPGLCATFFEYALNIVLEEVVGWDLTEDKSKEEGGAFGRPLAYTAAVEEQGRRTLHAHILIWLEGMKSLHEQIHSSNRQTQRAAKRKVERLADLAISTSLMSNNRYYSGNRNPFRHECITGAGGNPRPTVVDDQSLRNLRNKRTKLNSGGAFAYCKKCTKVWNNTSFTCAYLRQDEILPSLTEFPDSVQRLKHLMIARQASASVLPLDPLYCDAAYNTHQHTPSCFASAKNKRKSDDDGRNKMSPEDECRYRLPKRRRLRTALENATAKEIKWYKWTGEFSERHIKEAVIKRHEFDAFVNESCRAISKSKLGCNTNCSLLFPGPVAAYTFKYQTKNTQEEDTEQYRRVLDTTSRALEKRKHDSDNSEACRRLLAASFAHEKHAIVGSAMAAYLTRNGSRFKMSHKTVWVPSIDLLKLLVGQGVSASVNHVKDSSFFVNSALHYLCRPAILEDVSPIEFYTKYEVVRCTQKNRRNLLSFMNTPYFMHPSYQKRKRTFRQGIREKTCHSPLLPKIYQKSFPDAAAYNGDSILSTDVTPTDEMEEYSRATLLLFTPFRSLIDLHINCSFTEKLRDLVRRNHFSFEDFGFLQNIQDTAHNCWRKHDLQDDLQRHTKLAGNHEFDRVLFPNENPEEEDVIRPLDYDIAEELMEALNQTVPLRPEQTPSRLDSAAIRNAGTHRSGHEGLSPRNIKNETSSQFILAEENAPSENLSEERAGLAGKPSGKDLSSIIVSKTSRMTKSFEEITGKAEEVHVLQANGSARSIIDWSTKSGIDQWQRRAFEIFASTFVLTYHRLEDRKETSPTDAERLNRETWRLRKLGDAQRRRKKQLIALMHGPGGSGKTAVVNLLLAYAKEFCSSFEDHSLAFTSQTIVVTAMTGVAASMLNGETVHSRLYLSSNLLGNKTGELHDRRLLWEETRMVIIDEVSFCDKKLMNKINSNLKILTQSHLPFGGISVVFSGDFRQLEPPGRFSKPLYEDNCPAFRDKVNCLIELCGMHRFSEDPEFGEILMRIRDGKIFKQDIDRLNQRVVQPTDSLPEDLRYATFLNKDRDAINAGLFDMRCKDASDAGLPNSGNSILIFSDDLKMRVATRVYRRFRRAKHFWLNCSEDSLKQVDMNPRVDPVLKLYEGCPVMVSMNIDVRNGMANGTRALVKGVALRAGETPSMVNYSGCLIPAVLASQVEYVLCTHETKKKKTRRQRQCSLPAEGDFVNQPLTEESPVEFRIKPETFVFDVNLPIPDYLQVTYKEVERIRMKATQVPLLVNNATTGHKLQGATIKRIFVHSWRYEKNWPYVVLSRVTTLSGLFLRQHLSYDPGKYAVPKGYAKMMYKMKQHAPEYWNANDYVKMFPDTMIQQES